MNERTFPIVNGKLLTDLDANGHKIIGLKVEVDVDQPSECLDFFLDGVAGYDSDIYLNTNLHDKFFACIQYHDTLNTERKKVEYWESTVLVLELYMTVYDDNDIPLREGILQKTIPLEIGTNCELTGVDSFAELTITQDIEFRVEDSSIGISGSCVVRAGSSLQEYMTNDKRTEFELISGNNFRCRFNSDSNIEGEYHYVYPSIAYATVEKKESEEGVDSSVHVIMPIAVDEDRFYDFVVVLRSGNKGAVGIIWENCGELVEATPSASDMLPGINIWRLTRASIDLTVIDRIVPNYNSNIVLVSPSGTAAQITLNDDMTLEVKEA